MSRQRKRRGARRKSRLWLVPGSIVALGAGVLSLMFLVGEASEAAAAAVVSSASVFATSGYVIARGLRQRQRRVARVGLVVACLVVASIALVPALAVMLPGRPAVSGELRAVGDSLSVPRRARGSVRLLITATLPAARGTLRVELTGADAAIVAALHRPHVASGHGGVSHGATPSVSAYVEAEIPESSAGLTLAARRPTDAGPVVVHVYRVYFSYPVVLALYLLALAIVMMTEWRLGPGPGMSMGGIAVLLYGMNLRGGATPDGSLTPALMGILPSALLGFVVSLCIRYVIRRLQAAPGNRPASSQ